MAEIIIVGVDGSETAQRAAERAAGIAVKMGAELVVVTAHASDNTEVVKIGTDTWILDDAEQAEKLAEQCAASLRVTEPSATVSASAAHGKPQEVSGFRGRASQRHHDRCWQRRHEGPGARAWLRGHFRGARSPLRCLHC